MGVDARIESALDAYRGDGDVLRVSLGGPSLVERAVVISFGCAVAALGTVPFLSGVHGSRWFVALVFGGLSIVGGLLVVAWSVRALLRPVAHPLVVRACRCYAEVARDGQPFERTDAIERMTVTRRVVDGVPEASIVAEAAGGRAVFAVPLLSPRDAETLLARIAEHLQLVAERRGAQTFATLATPALANETSSRIVR